MGLELEFAPGQTPLDEDEKDGLLITSISNVRELNEIEQLNIGDDTGETAVRLQSNGHRARPECLAVRQLF